MRIKAKLKDLSFDRNGNALITLVTREDVREAFDELTECEVTAEIKKWHPKRSLDANAYAWVLLDQLSAKLEIPKEELYREEIRNVGGVSDYICIKQEKADAFRRTWENRGIGWQTEEIPSKVDGCVNLLCYKGSSEFDTKQMSDLIDTIIQDCESVGIPTMTDEQIAKLKGEWK